MATEVYVANAVVVVGAAIGAWILHSQRSGKSALAQANKEAEKIVADAERESRAKLRETEVAAKEKATLHPQ